MYSSVVDSNNGLETSIHVKDGDMHIETVQDCTAIAERMKAMHNEGIHGSSEMRFAGSIPEVFVVKYCNDNNILFSEFMQNKEHVRRLMNDPAMMHFRAWRGKL